MGELFQPTHLLLVAIVAMIFLGPKKLPELGKGLGEGIRGFRDALKPAPAPEPPKDEPKQVE
jgi:sec-independent protein translocase protein TatA